MSIINFEELPVGDILPNVTEIEFIDTSIKCIDCAQEFIWTAGEQSFFRDKQLQNPPKRCKDCKKAKNQRLEAIDLARTTGKRHRIEVKAECACCNETTTVPFYPCQGRPVYCRECFAKLNNSSPNSTNSVTQPPTWTFGRNSGSSSACLRISRVTGAVSPSPNNIYLARYINGFPSLQPK